MEKPLKLIKDKTAQFLFLFTNADSFYLNARHSFNYGWIAVGCNNAHQSIELYIKAILKLEHINQRGHDIVKILNKHKNQESYFSEILNNPVKLDFLKELSEAYISHRYGEAGSQSNSVKIIELLDELVFNLRNIYKKNIGIHSGRIYLPLKLKDDFLKNNKFFKNEDVTNNPMAQMMPDVGLPDFNFNSSGE